MAQENRAEIRERRRKQRAAERKAKRQAARQAQAGSGLITGIGARMQQRQTARQGRKSDRITARTSRIQSRSEGGFYDPESVSARWGAASDIAGTIGDVATGGAGSIASEALAAATGAFGEGDVVGLDGLPYTEEPTDWTIPIVLGVAAVGAYLLLSPKKKKGKK
jgi:hypothetical protein